MKKIRRSIYAAVAVISIFPQNAICAQDTIKANDDTVNISTATLPITLDHLTDNDVSTGGKFIFNASQPSKGHVQLKPNNILVFTPERGFTGTDSFVYALSSGANGTGEISTATVTIRNPYLLGKGLFSSEITTDPAAHESAGYLQILTDSKASFTANLRYAGQTFRIKNAFDSSGNYVARINRGGSLPDLLLDLQFALTGKPRMECKLTVGAQVTSFIAARSPWNIKNSPESSGRYTMVLFAPNPLAATPQGTGYAYFSVGVTGIVSIVGHTGENRSFSSSTLLQSNNSFPFYAPLYHGAGSLFGKVVINSDTTLTSNLTWFKPKNKKDLFYPKGFNLTVPITGSLYIEPEASEAILPVEDTSEFNSNFKVEAGNLHAARTERALLNERPDAGLYDLSFNNARRLSAKMVITPKTGIFRGKFYDIVTRDFHSITGVFVQSEGAAYGIWNSRTRSGRVELKPDVSGN